MSTEQDDDGASTSVSSRDAAATSVKMPELTHLEKKRSAANPEGAKDADRDGEPATKKKRVTSSKAKQDKSSTGAKGKGQGVDSGQSKDGERRKKPARAKKTAKKRARNAAGLDAQAFPEDLYVRQAINDGLETADPAILALFDPFLITTSLPTVLELKIKTDTTVQEALVLARRLEARNHSKKRKLETQIAMLEACTSAMDTSTSATSAASGSSNQLLPPADAQAVAAAVGDPGAVNGQVSSLTTHLTTISSPAPPHGTSLAALNFGLLCPGINFDNFAKMDID
ncbi:hypothetical protein Rhopal_002978-T1 [Rhodotorula paludigena]|uniref:Uncharacterized protein n=1 Tax=Rhodotorula paludigena TaxID=86838 RepID=A0AAV5GL57_9BASI|nr:hypothetical protein Rhopal_002978-T1 [Rhodotorula paludigena]